LNYSCTSLSSAVKSFMSFNLRAFFQTFQFPFFLSEVYRENLELVPAFDRGFFSNSTTSFVYCDWGIRLLRFFVCWPSMPTKTGSVKGN
jgi:hypothetical protein